ncbi:MAG: hypothetical protein NVS4B1_20830 [Ktedonobacteraceae bacterium]
MWHNILGRDMRLNSVMHSALANVAHSQRDTTITTRLVSRADGARSYVVRSFALKQNTCYLVEGVE